MKYGLMTCMVSVALFYGCAAPQPTGVLYTGTKQAISGNNLKYSKEGRATCKSVLSLIAFGDCSVEAAAKAGNITDIKVVDQEIKNIIGIYGQYTTIVKGD